MISRHFYAIAGIATLLTASGLATSHSHNVSLAGPTQQVLVVNGSSTPVPTAAQGTTQVGGTVAVSSLPAVQLGSGASVAISGTPTVGIAPDQSVKISGDVNETVAAGQTIGISGTPTVQIAPNQSITVSGDVNEHVAAGETIGINNTCANPIPVEVDCGHTPVDSTGTFVINDGQNSAGLLLYTVPSGKRLIVQNVSFNATMPTGETIIASLDRGIGAVLTFSIPLSHDGSWGSTFDSYSGALTGTNFAFNAGDQVILEVQRPIAVLGGTFHGAFSGYLEDAP